MQNENIALQAKVFLYHLNNSNNENGMRAGEKWKLCQVTESSKAEIERNYYPTVSTRVDPATMEEFSNSVMTNLVAQPKLSLVDHSIEALQGADYLIAFPPDRARR